MTPGTGPPFFATLPRRKRPAGFAAAERPPAVAVNAAQVAADFKKSRLFIAVCVFKILIAIRDDKVRCLEL